MKKIAKLMTVLAVAAFTFASCEDVPNSFGTVTPPTIDADDTNTELPYSSVNLNSGWTLEAVSADQPWSQSSSYVQATGYQAWDGGSKANRAVEGWLISPSFSTKGYENVKIFFDQTIKYTNNVSGWANYHKVYACNNFDETNINAATWVELAYKPVASPYSDWTLYSSGEIQLPASMVGQEAIRIAFWFKAPATASTTWELKNFNIAEGIADNTGGSGENPSAETIGTKENPLTVAQALEKINALADKGKTESKAYVKGKVVKVTTNQTNFEKYGNLNYVISDDGTESNTITVYSGDGLDGAKFTSINDIAAGDEVIVLGTLYKYVNNSGQVTPEIDSGNYLVSLVKGSGGGGDTPSAGEYGTKDAPLTVAKAIEIINGLADNGTASPAYVKGKISKVQSFNDKYKSITYYISDDGTDNNALQVYSGKGIDGADFAAQTDLETGWTVVVTGELKKYVNSSGAVTLEINQSSQIVSIDKNNSGGGGTTSDTYFEEPFETGQGNFTIDNKNLGEGLTFVWKHDSSNKYMKASGYASANKESESWLISPTIDLSNATNPTLTFAQVINKYFGTVANEAMVYVKKDGGEWTKVDITFPTIASGNWSKFTDEGANQSINLSSFKSSKTQFAFVYKSSTSAAGTWEIKTVKVAEAK